MAAEARSLPRDDDTAGGHDYNVQDYRDTLYLLSEGMWSIPCTVRNFVQTNDLSGSAVYLCPLFACDGSLETRAVGSGTFTTCSGKLPGWYAGKLNYYLKCIRGSTHSSGRCYDCKVVHRIIAKNYLPKNDADEVENVTFAEDLQEV